MDSESMAAEKIKPVAVVPVKRQRMSNFNWAACIFCQQTALRLSIGSKDGINKVKEAFSIRTACGDDNQEDILKRLTPVIDNINDNAPKWHARQCYSSFCSITNFNRLQKT